MDLPDVRQYFVIIRITLGLPFEELVVSTFIFIQLKHQLGNTMRVHVKLGRVNKGIGLVRVWRGVRCPELNIGSTYHNWNRGRTKRTEELLRDIVYRLGVFKG